MEMERFKKGVYADLPKLLEVVKAGAIEKEIGVCSGWISARLRCAPNGPNSIRTFRGNDIDKLNQGIWSLGEKLMQTNIVWSSERTECAKNVKEGLKRLFINKITKKRLNFTKGQTCMYMALGARNKYNSVFSESQIQQLIMEAREIGLSMLSTEYYMDKVINVVSNNIVKSPQSGKSVQSETIAVTRKSSRERFIAFVCAKEKIGLNKFFKLFEEFKNEDPCGFKDYLLARKMDANVDYTYKWFSLNCPSITDENGKKHFAKWVKVSEKNPKSEKVEYNRTTATGVEYTLKVYNCFKANYEQYEAMLNHVVSNVKRIRRETESLRKAPKKRNELIKSKMEEVARLQAQLQKLRTA